MAITANVKAIFTTRNGAGVKSQCLLGLNYDHVDDDELSVGIIALYCSYLPSEPYWLKQVHGKTHLIDNDDAHLEVMQH